MKPDKVYVALVWIDNELVDMKLFTSQKKASKWALSRVPDGMDDTYRITIREEIVE